MLQSIKTIFHESQKTSYACPSRLLARRVIAVCFSGHCTSSTSFAYFTRDAIHEISLADVFVYIRSATIDYRFPTLSPTLNKCIRFDYVIVSSFSTSVLLSWSRQLCCFDWDGIELNRMLNKSRARFCCKYHVIFIIL